MNMQKQILSKSAPAFVSPRAPGMQEDQNILLEEAALRASRYLAGLDQRPVFPQPDAVAGLAAFDESLPASPRDPFEVLRLLDTIGSPATVTSAGGRYFGFVIGGAFPV